MTRKPANEAAPAPAGAESVQPDALDRACYLAGSHERAGVLVDGFPPPDERKRWFEIAGKHWSSCDDIAVQRPYLTLILAEASRAELDAMMTADELEVFRRLPHMLTVYRGCYEFNRVGLSWSLDRATASAFPKFARYRHSGKQALLLTGRVSKERAFLKLDRGEQEIVAPRVKRIQVEALP